MRWKSHVWFGDAAAGNSPGESRDTTLAADAHWAATRRTDINELTLACPPNNRLVEEQGWTTRKKPKAKPNGYHHHTWITDNPARTATTTPKDSSKIATTTNPFDAQQQRHVLSRWRPARCPWAAAVGRDLRSARQPQPPRPVGGLTDPDARTRTLPRRCHCSVSRTGLSAVEQVDPVVVHRDS